MASKKRYSYRWSLFFPMLGIIWGIMLILIVYQYYAFKDANDNIKRIQLEFIGKRLIDAYDHDTDMRQFMNFVSSYLEENYNDGTVMVYNNADDKIEYSIGINLIQDGAELIRKIDTDEIIKYKSGNADINEAWYFKKYSSDDGKISVIAAVPGTDSLWSALEANKRLWYIILAIALAATYFCYLSTRYLTKNVTLLKKFAESATESNFNYDESSFPHDELGDISRQLVKLYREKVVAVEQTEKEHRIALHAVEEKARIKKQLTNNINHELKTPIGVIKGYIDTLLSTPDIDDATRTRFLTRTQENVERLCNLLSDVSTMTRLEDGTGNIPVAEIDFHDLVFTIESDARMSGITGNMKLYFDLPLDCKVKGNTSLLTGLVSNLIRNAAQHSHGTEMHLDLVIESDKYYTFSFFDNGTGVAEEHLPHLFERFYRIDAGRSRKVGGTGLGLPIVKNTIEALGGSVSVHNRAEGGLEFLFTLEKWVPKIK